MKFIRLISPHYEKWYCNWGGMSVREYISTTFDTIYSICVHQMASTLCSVILKYDLDRKSGSGFYDTISQFVCTCSQAFLNNHNWIFWHEIGSILGPWKMMRIGNWILMLRRNFQFANFWLDLNDHWFNLIKFLARDSVHPRLGPLQRSSESESVSWFYEAVSSLCILGS